MTFEKYRKPKSRPGGTCAKCGGPGEGRVVFTLQAREQVPGRTSKDNNAVRYPAVDSTSRTLCESCAVELYEAAKALLP